MLDFIAIRSRIFDRQRGIKPREQTMGTVHHNGTIKTVAEIYGFEQVILIGRREGQPDFVASYGDNRASAGFARRLSEFLQHKLTQWRDCDMDKISERADAIVEGNAAPPPGAAS